MSADGRLGADAADGFPPVLRLADVGSTNDEAFSRLRADGTALWVVAERQLSGRGRRGRAWISERGNLYASLAFPCGLTGEAFGLLPLAAAVALADAIAAATRLDPQLKWPNDVLIAGDKVAGILVEAEHAGPSRRVVVGFGVNIVHHPEPEGSLVRPTHLAAHCNVAAAEIFATLRPAVAAVLGALAEPDGVAAIRARWLGRAVGIGGPITVRFDGEAREGIFAGLDAAGRLLLARPDGGTEPIAAGDVFVRTAA